MTLLDAVLLFVAAFTGGALNAVAGGGSFFTFPTLVFLGIPEIPANASSAVALWPGSLAGAGAYRANLNAERRLLLPFSIVSLLGGLLGAWLLLRTPGDTFELLIPWLLLVATVIFAYGGKLTWKLRRRDSPATREPRDPASFAGLALHLVIATYGGFFGGGMGIMILAAFAAIGMQDVHFMNGLKNWCAVWINGIAVVTFIVAGIVTWPHTLVMLFGAVIGGYAGAHSAQRVDPLLVRRFIITVGVVLTVWFFYQYYV